MTDLPWAQALLCYGALPFLGFVGGFLWSKGRRERRNKGAVPRMYGRYR